MVECNLILLETYKRERSEQLERIVRILDEKWLPMIPDFTIQETMAYAMMGSDTYQKDSRELAEMLRDYFKIEP